MAKYRILSFDGGGIRGILSISLIKRLYEKFPSLLNNTSIFAGTSTGAFIALALAYGIKPKEVAGLYSEENGNLIFASKRHNPFRPAYENKNLESLLLTVFPKELRLKDLKKKVMITSFEVDDCITESWNPIFFNNFINSKTQYEYVIDVALSSSAVPILFPSHKKNIDGGVIANNPGTAAIALAVDKNAGRQKIDDICLLSVGTGYNALKISSDTSKWGLFQWSLSSPPSYPILTLLLDGAVEADTMLSSQFLGERYFRLNPELTESIALSDYKKISYLKDIAEKYDLAPTIEWLKVHWK